jgi:hypothetical protein
MMRAALFTFVVALPGVAIARPTAPPAPSAPPAEPESLDRAAISAGMAIAKPKVMACGDSEKATGKIKVSIGVAPEGTVRTVTTDRPAGDKLAVCLVAAIKTVPFKKTKQGGSFTYPFVFGTATPTPAPAPATTTGTGLDRAMISDGIAKVKAKVAACGTGANASVHGKVKIKVTVAPAGSVASAVVESAPAGSLGTCVAGVLKGATFAKTDAGGSFSYPFVF